MFNCPIHGMVGDQDNDGECWKCNHEAYFQKRAQMRKEKASRIIGHLLVLETNGRSTRLVMERASITEEEFESWLTLVHVLPPFRWVAKRHPNKLGVTVIEDARPNLDDPDLDQMMVFAFLVPVFGNRDRIAQSIRSILRSEGHEKVSMPKIW